MKSLTQRFLLAILLIATCQTALFAADAPKYLSKERFKNNITLAKLSNGLTVIVQEHHVAPVATVRCFVKNTGSIYEGRWLGSGISHLAEHLVSGGTTEKWTEAEKEAMLTSFGGTTNAYTSTNKTAYFINCPAKNVDTAIELVTNNVTGCSFNETEVKREFGVVQQELADRLVKRNVVGWELQNQTIYRKHPIRLPIIGNLEVLQGLNRDDLVEFFAERYVPNNQIFVVVGDVETEAILKKVAEAYAGVKEGPTYCPSLPEVPPQMAPRYASKEMEGETFDVSLSWPTVSLAHEDLYALDIASYLLGNGESSRLVRKLKHEKGLVLGVDVGSFTPAYVKGYFYVSLSSNEENYNTAIDTALAEVNRLKTELVSPAEIKRAAKQVAASNVFGKQAVEDLASELAGNYMAFGDLFANERYLAGLKKVTPEDVQRVIRKYIQPNQLNIVTVTPLGKGSVARLGDAQPQEKVAGQEASEKMDKNDVQLHTLDNGLRVLIKRHAALPMVEIKAYTLGANLVDTPETAGRAQLFAAMLDKGTKTRSAQEIALYFDSIGGQFGSSAGRFTTYLTATVLAEDFSDAFTVFADCLQNPAFPEDEFKRTQARMLLGLGARKASPFAQASDLWCESLPATTPFHVIRSGTPETVKALTRQDLVDYHKNVIVPAGTVITLFGDLDPKEALAMVQAKFGTMKTPSRYKKLSLDRSNVLPKSVTKYGKIQSDSAVLFRAFPIPSSFDAKETAAITMFYAIADNYGVMGGRLFNSIRGAGLVYSVYGHPMSGPVPGYYLTLAQMQPANVQKVLDKIDAVYDGVEKGEFTDEEFTKAKQLILSKHSQTNTTIGEQATQGALDELYGFGYDYDKGFDARINAATREDMLRVIKKCREKSVLVVVTPDAPEEEK